VTATREYRPLPIAKIDPNPSQPRRHFDPDALAELGRSIRDQGLLQPVAVRPHQCGRFLLIAGERRWRACKAVGLKTIDARVLEGLSEADAFALSLLENVTRADMLPMEEVRAYGTLRDLGRTVEEVAAATGKTTRWVNLFLGLLNLTPDLQHLLDGGGIRIGLAIEASKLQPDGQHVVLRKHLAGEFPGDREAAAFCAALKAAEDQADLFEVPDDQSVREALRARRAALELKLDRINGAGLVLGEIAAMDPHTVARLLAGRHGGVPAHRDQVKAVAAQAAKALAVLRRAAAIADAHTTLNTAVEATS
jgi:ParB family chromosome partitioning protein